MTKQIDQFTSNDESYNLAYLVRRVIRNRKLIGAATIISIILSIIAFLNTKKTWEGQFQIVLSSDSNPKSPKIPESFQALSLLNRSEFSNKLKTQVGILESPSVLMPIFEFVNQDEKDLNFYEWKENLKISLKKNTSILNISYSDKKKEVILPVLKKVSNAFQKYSSKNKIRNIQITKKYLSDQIKLYESKSAKSISDAQKFAMSQDLFLPDLGNNNNFNRNQNRISNEVFLSNIDIERIRVNAADEIRNLKEQLNIIIALEDPEKLQYIGSTIPILNKEGLPQKLEELENELIRLRTKYTENSKEIKFNLKERDLMIKLLKNRAIGIINAQILTNEARLKSAIRPEGVILKYKKMMRDAQRDETTLVKLEDQLRLLKLEEARYEDPWELITNPTLLNDPISPGISIYIFIGLLIGSSTGILIATFKENKYGKIYEEEILTSYFSCDQLIKFEIENKLTENIEVKIIRDIIINSSKVSFIKTSNISNQDIEKTKTFLFNEKRFKKFDNYEIIEDNYDLIDKKNTLILLLKRNSIIIDDLKLIKHRIEFAKIKIDGIILV